MLKLIDRFLNGITMYKLVFYELVFLLLAAAGLGALGILSFDPIYLAFSALFIFSISWIGNGVFSYFFDAPYNPESTWITALILALIITPPAAFVDGTYLPLAVWASLWAVASKYLLAIRKKHIFNPAALGVAVPALTLGLSASWWVGTPAMVPFVLVGGLLIVRKIHRFDLWWAFIGAFFIGILYFTIDHHLDIVRSLEQSFLTAPTFFFATVMLTEPQTAPSTRLWRMLFGAGVAVLFLPNVSIGSFYFTPELALLAGNIGAYLVSPKGKIILTLKEKIRRSADVFELVFAPERQLAFSAGQYMEWTLPHEGADSRGVRRYFTLSSSPEEGDVRLGVKFYAPASTFKRKLFSMQPGDSIVAAQLAGDFTLPRDRAKKLVFIAGGIGITPFASMLRHLIATHEQRDIVVLYANKTPADAVYHELLEEAERELGIKTVHVFSAPPSGAPAKIDAALVASAVPDYAERTFYISGPQGMVASFKGMLRGLGVSRLRIKTDYFPGFA